MRKYTLEEKEEALRRREIYTLMNMLNDGINPEELVIFNHTDILLEALNKKNKNLFKMVLNKDFPNQINKYFLYVHHAVRTNDIFFVREILEHYKLHDIDINEYSPEKNNCLHIAYEVKNISQEIIDLLLENNIDPHEKNINGMIPLTLRNKKI